jgi:hypothetical protein
MFDVSDETSSTGPAERSYRAPKVVAIGKATDLLQGLTSGKHFDGSSGYWWNEEGG